MLAHAQRRSREPAHRRGRFILACLGQTFVVDAHPGLTQRGAEAADRLCVNPRRARRRDGSSEKAAVRHHGPANLAIRTPLRHGFAADDRLDFIRQFEMRRWSPPQLRREQSQRAVEPAPLRPEEVPALLLSPAAGRDLTASSATTLETTSQAVLGQALERIQGANAQRLEMPRIPGQNDQSPGTRGRRNQDVGERRRRASASGEIRQESGDARRRDVEARMRVW